MVNPRIEAAKLLTKIEKEQSYSSLLLSSLINNVVFSHNNDTSLFVALVYGVLEHKILLDYNISLYLNDNIRKLKPIVLNILRVGAFQILYSDKIPDSAAVNEAVKSSKKLSVSFASGLINAVLRKIAQNSIKVPDIDSDTINYLSIKHSINYDIVKILLSQYDYDILDTIFASFSGRRPIYVRLNTLKCDEKKLYDSVIADGVKIEKTSLENCYSIFSTGDIAKLEAYKKGYFHVQDMSSQYCCHILSAKPGDTVLDSCAAPGGKSFTIAQMMQNNGNIVSCDIHEHKVNLITKGADRLGINNISAQCVDARNIDSLNVEFDKVLCDAPCSGLGVIGRKPEIRYKNINDIYELPNLQKEILYSVAKKVKIGGSLLYSTCTLNKLENESVCYEFLKDFSNFTVDTLKSDNNSSDFLTVLPSNSGGDGFFIAKFIRNN